MAFKKGAKLRADTLAARKASQIRHVLEIHDKMMVMLNRWRDEAIADNDQAALDHANERIASRLRIYERARAGDDPYKD